MNDSIYRDAVSTRNAAVEKLKSAARSVGFQPGRGLVGFGQGLRPGADRVAVEVNRSRGKVTVLNPAKVQELGIDNALNITPIIREFLAGVEPHDRVRALVENAESIRQNYGQAARGQVLTSSELGEPELRTLADIFNKS